MALNFKFFPDKSFKALPNESCPGFFKKWITGDMGLTPGDTFTFLISATRNFGGGDIPATFTYPLLDNSNTTSNCHSASCSKASLQVGIQNAGGDIAKQARLDLEIQDSGGIKQAEVHITAPRLAGES